jgi:hypothetical protein
VTDSIPQLVFSFYRHRSIHADFSGGQITSDAGLLPLRAFDSESTFAARSRFRKQPLEASSISIAGIFRDVTKQNSSPNCLVGSSSKGLSRPQEIEHCCQCQAD